MAGPGSRARHWPSRFCRPNDKSGKSCTMLESNDRASPQISAIFKQAFVLRCRTFVHARKRPRRYTLRLPVKYRATGERHWHEGTTVSLSESGAVIDGDVLPSRDQHVVVMISLPSGGGCLSGRGRIV